MKLLDCTQLFDIGEKITLSSDFLDRYYGPDYWQQDCINTQNKQGALEIIKVDHYNIRIKGTTGNWYLGLSDIDLYQLNSYKDNYETLYAFAKNQVLQGKKRNISSPLLNAFDWGVTSEGYDFWKTIFSGKHPKIKESIETSNKNQQQTTQNNNHEIRLQKQKATIIRGTRPEGDRICSSKHKASIRSGQISYTACHC